MKICLIGSSRFLDQYVQANKDLTLRGHVVYSIATVSSSDGGELPEDQKMILDLVHLRKIEQSDVIVLVTDPSGYYGFSTKREMIWSQMLGKDVVLYIPGQDDPLFTWRSPFFSQRALDLPTPENLAKMWDDIVNPKSKDNETGGPIDNSSYVSDGNGRPVAVLGIPGGEA